MEIEIERKTKEVLQVTLPAYRKDAARFYKVYEDYKYVCVFIAGGNTSIANGKGQLPFHTASEECTRQDFEQAFSNAVQILESL